MKEIIKKMNKKVKSEPKNTKSHNFKEFTGKVKTGFRSFLKGLFTKTYGYLILAIIIMSIFVLVNIGVSKLTLPSIDLSSNKIHSLSKESKDYIKNLDGDVNIYLFSINESAEMTYVKNFLNEYSATSSKIKYTVINPETDTQMATKYGIVVAESSGTKTINGGSYSLIFEKGSKIKAIDSSLLYEQGVYETNITNAIVEVNSQKVEKVYLMTGYTDTSLQSGYQMFSAILQKEIFSMEEMNIKTRDNVPEDTSILIIPNITRDLDQADADKITNFFKSGGKILAMQDYSTTDMPIYDSVLASVGISTTKSVISEGDVNKRLSGNKTYIIPQYASNDMIKRVSSKNIETILYKAMPINKLTLPEDSNLTVETLMSTSEKASSGTETKSFDTATVSSIKVDDTKQGKFVFISNASFLTDSMNNTQNVDLVIDIFKGLSKRTDILNIDKSVAEIKYITITDTIKYIIYSIVIIIPVIILIIGATIYIKRKRK